MKGAVPLLLVGAMVPGTGFAIAALSQTGIADGISETVQLLSFTPDSPTSETWLVIPDSIHDGDTLRVGRDGQELKIRLCGIDAPELAQPLGEQSRDYLRSLLAQNPYSKVIIVPVEEDAYGRTVAELFLWPDDDPDQEIGVNSAMLMAGMAYVYPQYVDGCPNGDVFKRAETIGQEAKAGVWSGKYQRPWEYRR
ncbi:MAG: thermonuclease family protein [Cyanobacteria bacterium J06648_16]